LFFEFHFQCVGRSKHDIRLLTALCQMPRFVFNHACVDCCQQWLQTCANSVALLRQYVCGGTIDHWLPSSLWPRNELTSEFRLHWLFHQRQRLRPTARTAQFWPCQATRKCNSIQIVKAMLL